MKLGLGSAACERSVKSRSYDVLLRGCLGLKNSFMFAKRAGREPGLAGPLRSTPQTGRRCFASL